MADTITPTSVEELSAALRDTVATAPVVEMHGSGSKAGWGGIGPAPDLVIDTTGLTGPVDHAAGDLVVTVPAGTRLAALQAQLRSAGQWLPLDPPEPDATVGGVVSAAASGPRRLRFGTPRDLLLGIQVVLADGTVARSGGRVVKNVAGYDLGKLFTGAWGTLGVITECTFRLHPLPPAQRVVLVDTDDPAAADEALRRVTAVPVAAEWDGSRLTVLVESSPAGAQAQAEAIAAALGGAVRDEPSELFGQRPWPVGGVGLKATHRLGALAPTLAALRSAFPAARLSAQVGSGVCWLGLATAPDGFAAALTEARRALTAYDGTVVVVRAPDRVRATADVWGPVRGLELMRRIKEQFDPGGRMHPGRYAGGI